MTTLRLTKRLALAASLAVLATACSAAQATPQTIEVPGPTIEVPGPTQAIELEVTPQICRDALAAADLTIGGSVEFTVDVLSAYVDYPDEDLLDFGRRVEDLISAYDSDALMRPWDDYTVLADRCIAS